MAIRITILGCGSSGGVPRVAQGWGACDPNEPKNRRRRCSILVDRIGEGGKTRVLIDTSPDLREQLIDAGVMALDAILYTHDHADHTHGIDDLRPLVLEMRRQIDVYADAPTRHTLEGRFAYAFRTPEGSDYPPILRLNPMEPNQPLTIDGAGGPLTFLPIPLIHGNQGALGFRFHGVAYSPDVSAIPEASIAHFAGLTCWIIDALRDRPHPTHFSLSEALAWLVHMQPQSGILTNLHNDLDYGRLVRELPESARPAHDGLVLIIDE